MQTNDERPRPAVSLITSLHQVIPAGHKEPEVIRHLEDVEDAEGVKTPRPMILRLAVMQSLARIGPSTAREVAETIDTHPRRSVASTICELRVLGQIKTVGTKDTLTGGRLEVIYAAVE